MSIFSKLLGRSGGDGDPDQPLAVGAVPNAESVGGAKTESIGGGRTENVNSPEVEDEVLVAFEHGDVRNGADPDGGGQATGDPFAVKIEHVVPPGEPGGAELQENLSINFAKFEVDQSVDVEPPGDLADRTEGGEDAHFKYSFRIPPVEDVEPPGDLAADGEPSETPGNVYLKMEEIVGSEPPGGGVLTGGGVGTAEAPAGADDGSIPTETLSLNFDKVTLHNASGGPGANELVMDDTAGAEAAGGDLIPPGDLGAGGADPSENLGDYFLKMDPPPDGAALEEGGIASFTHKVVGPSKFEEDPDGGGPVGELAKKAAGEQEYLEVKLENVQITSYQFGVLDNNGEDPDGGGPDSLTAGPGAGVMMKESGEKGGTEDILIGMPDEPPAFDPGFRGGVSVGAGDVTEAKSSPLLSEIVVTKTTDSTSPSLMDDDDGATLESLAVQEPGAIGGAIGGFSTEGEDGAPDLDDLDLDDDADIEL